MQTEADAPPFTELPVEECPSVTRVALVEEEAVAKTMTVKEEAQAEEEEEEEDEEEISLEGCHELLDQYTKKGE